MARSFSGIHPAVGSEGLLLYAVAAQEAGMPATSGGLESVSVRELGAVVRRHPYRRVDATTEAITDYRGVTGRLHAERTVVPAPFGTVFRSRDSLTGWLELHYLALMDALEFVRGRSAMRVRITPAPGADPADFETTVFDSVRFLKRSAMACVTPPGTPSRQHAEASFLIDREKVDSFVASAREEDGRLPEVNIEPTGPWPAYDFVRLQFGS